LDRSVFFGAMTGFLHAVTKFLFACANLLLENDAKKNAGAIEVKLTNQIQFMVGYNSFFANISPRVID
jgi:hypothetical protein